MSRSEDGARVVAEVLKNKDAYTALEEAIIGRREAASEAQGTPVAGTGIEALESLNLEPQQVDPAQGANISRIDRENGLVLIAEILKNYTGDLLDDTKQQLEGMLRTGGEMVMSERLVDQQPSTS
jgi:hypothetical protein